jgi:hypothetical protein
MVVGNDAPEIRELLELDLEDMRGELERLSRNGVLTDDQVRNLRSIVSEGELRLHRDPAAELPEREVTQVSHLEYIAERISDGESYNGSGDSREFSRAFYERVPALPGSEGLFIDDNIIQDLFENAVREVDAKLSTRELGFAEEHYSDLETVDGDQINPHTRNYNYTTSFCVEQTYELLEKAREAGLKIVYNNRIWDRLGGNKYSEEEMNEFREFFDDRWDLVEGWDIQPFEGDPNPEDSGIAVSAISNGLDVVSHDSDFLEIYDDIRHLVDEGREATLENYGLDFMLDENPEREGLGSEVYTAHQANNLM